MSGRSSERLVEELAEYLPGAVPAFCLPPVDEMRIAIAQGGAATKDSSGYTVPLPEPPIGSDDRSQPPRRATINGFFMHSREHLQVEKLMWPAEADEFDWNLVEESAHGCRALLRCSLTGAELRVDYYSQELPPEIRLGFSDANIAQRYAKAGLTPPITGQPGSLGGIADAWNLFSRIVADLIVTPRDSRRSISPAAQRPAVLLDLPSILPFVGFVYDPQSQLFVPPKQQSHQYLNWLRRVLLEIKLETVPFDQRWPLERMLSEFLHTLPPYSETTGVLKACYACLGAASVCSDEQVWRRYRLAAQQDSSNIPWFLEALSRIAQSRQSEVLETKVMELVSLGNPTLSSLQTELDKLGIDTGYVLSVPEEQLVTMVLDIPTEDAKNVLNAAVTLRSSAGLVRAAAGPSISVQDAVHLLRLPPNYSPADVASRFLDLWEQDSVIDRFEARCALRALAFDQYTKFTPPEEKQFGEIEEVNPQTALLALYEDFAPPSAQPQPSLDGAYNILGIPGGRDIGDADLEAIFTANSEDASFSRLLELRSALRVIAQHRNSIPLCRFLGMRTDDMSVEPEEACPRPPRMPVGLWNIGNTCYLNSLLQFYYSVPAIRDYVSDYALTHSKMAHESDEQVEREIVELAETEINESGKELGTETETTELPERQASEMLEVEPEELITESVSMEPGTKEVIEQKTEKVNKPVSEEITENVTKLEPKQEVVKRIGGRNVPGIEIRRCEIFVAHLGELFRDITNSLSAHVTPSEMLAYMALIPPQEDASEVVAAENNPSMLRCRLIGALQRQQDVTESIENVLDQLEATMPAEGVDSTDGEQLDLVKTLFYGSTVQVLQRIRDGGNRRTKTERFSSLLVDVGEAPSDLYAALDGYFADDVFELEDEGDTLRTLKIKSLPQLLQIQVQRVQFDIQTYMPYKNLNPLRFDDIVYMDRYMEAPEGSELDMRRHQAQKLRTELHEVRKILDARGPQILNGLQGLTTTASWLESNGEEFEVSEETMKSIARRIEELRTELNDLEEREKMLESELTHVFDAFKQHGFRLHALFIHKGEVSYGHYWIYIRNEETGKFMKYNDEFVSEASDEEVYCFEHQPATPYYLVFKQVTA